MIKQNLHTHSVYCDGKDTIDQMAQTAIQKGFTVLGFSGHGPCRFDDVAMKEKDLASYRKEILEAKEKYKDQIQIYGGIEEDIWQRVASKDFYDYVIGSKHFVKVRDQVKNVDYSPAMTDEIVSLYGGDFLAYAKDYYEDIKRIAQFEEVDIVGHLDLLMKFNEEEQYCSFTDPAYLGYAQECIDVLVQAGKIFEINTGAIARGYRKYPYPHKRLLEYIFQKGGKIILNSDCHDRNMLDCHYPESMKLIRDLGFTSMMVLTPEGFKEAPIDQFSL